MFKSAQVLASTTLLCGVLALSGCGASQAGQGAEDTSAHPSASASVKPGTISVASESPSASVAPGSITVVNSASPEHGESSSTHPRSLARRITSRSTIIRPLPRTRQSTRAFPRSRAIAITVKSTTTPILGTVRVLPRIPVPLPRTRVRRIPPAAITAATATVITTVARADPIIPARRTPRAPRSAPWMI